MSIISSLYIGAGAMTANSLELEVVGDNIANANTVGFKGSRATFADVVGQSLIGGAGQLGGGARLQTVQKLIAQGALSNTGIATDLAVNGDGFFIVNTPDGNMYTRAGQFTLDDDGFLVNQQGLHVQGFPADPTGGIGATLGDLDLASATSPPQATTSIQIDGTLDPGAAAQTFDINNAAATSDLAVPVQVFDAQGTPHDVTLFFTKTTDNTWEWHATIDGSQVGGIAGTPVDVGSGTMTFDADGNLLDAGTPAFSIPLTGGAATPLDITLDLGTAIGLPGGLGNDGITQIAGRGSAATFVSQDGFTGGTLSGVTVLDDGTVSGQFSNGQTRALGQVALASFEAPDQLERIGNNLFRATTATGDVNVGRAGSGEMGTIVAGALEQSNVDLASEFVRMIVAQRSFQANSKTLQTADSLLAELIQIKR